MDVVFQLQGVEFKWDEEKYAANLQKHGVKFEDAAQVFFDPFCQFGDASVDEETREFVVGFSFDFQLLFTVFVERGERVRIISARETTENERKNYARRK
jgi:uncharacterized DUF497 family protein